MTVMVDPKKEKRKFKRYNVDGVHGNMLFSSDVNIINISIDGSAIETTKRLNIDKEYALKIKYKDNILNLKGFVVWSILSHTETRKNGEVIPIYKSGMRFTNVLSEKSSNLLRFIDENKTESIEKRVLGVRFKIKRTGDAMIDYPYEYNVKRLSLSGMLIETDNTFDIDSSHDMEIFLDNRILPVFGRIVNCVESKSEDLTRYDIGIEFVSMSDEDKKFLSDFLGSLENSGEKG